MVEQHSVYKNTYTSIQISDLKDKIILAILHWTKVHSISSAQALYQRLTEAVLQVMSDPKRTHDLPYINFAY